MFIDLILVITELEVKSNDRNDVNPDLLPTLDELEITKNPTAWLKFYNARSREYVKTSREIDVTVPSLMIIRFINKNFEYLKYTS